LAVCVVNRSKVHAVDLKRGLCYFYLSVTPCFTGDITIQEADDEVIEEEEEDDNAGPDVEEQMGVDAEEKADAVPSSQQPDA
jgi:hypothetical protein